MSAGLGALSQASSGRGPSTEPVCLRCELRDPERLYSITLVRPYRPHPGGKQKVRSIPARLCGPCAPELLRRRERWEAYRAEQRRALPTTQAERAAVVGSGLAQG
jgi:hypothetical protein